MKYFLKIFIVSVCVVVNVYADPQRVIWDKKPIPVMLRVGHERIIHFPADIRYWIPETIEASVTALSANGVLYLQAREPFEKTRIRIQEVDTQKIYLLDVTGTEKGWFHQELIVVNKEQVENLSKQATPLPSEDDWYIRLTRFAAQYLYAPERLSPADADIRKTSISSDPVPLIRNSDIEAVPVAAWSGGGLTITAVRLSNLAAQDIVFATRKNNTLAQAKVNPPGRLANQRIIDLSADIKGSWLTVSVQHGVLKGKGSKADSTILYLISKQPFEASL